MKKKIRQRMTNPARARSRKLELTRETVRTLGEDELARAVGGEGTVVCNTTSYTTERLSTHC
jgi:hypothetical protein